MHNFEIEYKGKNIRSILIDGKYRIYADGIVYRQVADDEDYADPCEIPSWVFKFRDFMKEV